MAKTMPYFKFMVSEWADGDITLLPMDAQGLFINICSAYWSREGRMTQKYIKRRWPDYWECYQLLVSENLIINLDSDLVSIRFLDQQMGRTDRRSETSAVNGLKGGRPREPKNLKNNLNTPNIDKRREEKIREEERKKDAPAPLLSGIPYPPNLTDWATAIADKFGELTGVSPAVTSFAQWLLPIQRNGRTLEDIMIVIDHANYKSLEKGDRNWFNPRGILSKASSFESDLIAATAWKDERGRIDAMDCSAWVDTEPEQLDPPPSMPAPVDDSPPCDLTEIDIFKRLGMTRPKKGGR